jgi:AAA15 family ATPase/GTPase
MQKEFYPPFRIQIIGSPNSGKSVFVSSFFNVNPNGYPTTFLRKINSLDFKFVLLENDEEEDIDERFYFISPKDALNVTLQDIEDNNSPIFVLSKCDSLANNPTFFECSLSFFKIARRIRNKF